MNAPVTAHVSSKERYFTTLPGCILSVIQQTVKPERFIIFLDGEHLDLRDNDLYLGLFRMMDFYRIQWEVVFGAGRGQVLNHQQALNMCNTKMIWRLDDDTFAQPDVLENLLSCDSEKVGAVGGLVIDPRSLGQSPPHKIDRTINNVSISPQWFFYDPPTPFEVEHLYSTFLFKKEAATHGYCMDLSPVAHREETLLSYEMHRLGWKLIVNPKAVTWHVRQGQGGIRTHQNHPEYWEFDEKVFKMKLKEWGVLKPKDNSLVVLDNGMGDHVMFKNILPELRQKYGKLTIALCYPEIFEDEQNIDIISIAEAKDRCRMMGKNIDDYNIYKYCADRNWKKSMIEAYREMYLGEN